MLILIALISSAALSIRGAPLTAQDANTRKLAAAHKRVRSLESAIITVTEKIRAATVAIFALTAVEHEGARRFVRTSGGSGVIIDPDGLILSNDHVAGHCDAIEIVLTGGRTLPAKLVAKDQKGDIVLLKIEGRRFPYVSLGDSGAVQVGEWVLAAGNPFFLGATGQPVVTIGVVSAKDRVLGGVWEYAGSIQTDAEINPGNSGGPLFNMKGELIGINGKIATRHGRKANTGAGYAIPIDRIKAFLPSLKQGRNIVRGYSGVRVNNEPVRRGVHVFAVDGGSPAAKRGVQPKDVITAVNGKPVNSARDYVNQASTLTVGKTLVLSTRRGGRSRVVRLKLVADPNRPRKKR